MGNSYPRQHYISELQDRIKIVEWYNLKHRELNNYIHICSDTNIHAPFILWGEHPYGYTVKFNKYDMRQLRLATLANFNHRLVDTMEECFRLIDDMPLCPIGQPYHINFEEIISKPGTYQYKKHKVTVEIISELYVKITYTTPGNRELVRYLSLEDEYYMLANTVKYIIDNAN